MTDGGQGDGENRDFSGEFIRHLRAAGAHCYKLKDLISKNDIAAKRKDYIVGFLQTICKRIGGKTEGVHQCVSEKTRRITVSVP